MFVITLKFRDGEGGQMYMNCKDSQVSFTHDIDEAMKWKKKSVPMKLVNVLKTAGFKRNFPGYSLVVEEVKDGSAA